jgi:hypothetical protein
LPYTPEQLAAIADMLGRDKDDQLVRFVVGIARRYVAQKDQPPHFVALRDNARKQASAANQAANLLDRLDRLYRQPGGLLLGAPLGQLYRLLMQGEIRSIIERLHEFAEKASNTGAMLKLDPGRRPDNEAISAQVQLRAVWKDARGNKRGMSAFEQAALEPLGYCPGKTAHEKRRQAARKALGH